MDDESRGKQSRRDVLTALGACATASLAGCTGLGDRRSLNPPDVLADSPTSLVWTFPADAPDGEAVVEVFLDQRSFVPTDDPTAAVRFRFGATVFGHSDYRHDRVTARFRAPAWPDGDTSAVPLFVAPPGGGQSTRVRREGRETVVVLDDLDTTGTIHFEFTAAPRTGAMPERLGYEFAVSATRPGLTGGTAVASETGTMGIAREQ